MALKKAAAVSIPAPHKILLAETEKRTSLLAALETLPLPEVGSAAKIHLAIGPEGGWTEAELQLFSTHGWTPASLGTTILRAETAAIAAVAVLVSRIIG